MIELRPLTADDLEEVCALHNRSEAFDGVKRVLELDELREELDDEHVVHATDTRIALRDGEPAGYAYTYHLPSETDWERCYVFGEVDPAHRRGGVGTALLTWGVERAAEQLRAPGRDLPKYVRVDAYDHIESAQHLYRSLGFAPVRWFEELLRPLTDLPPACDVPGVRIEPWPLDGATTGRDEELRALKIATFADHWGSTPPSSEQWSQMVRGFGARADLSFVALDVATGADVAFCLNKRFESDDEVLGRRDGWIDNLGTVAAWRGRGVASELIVRSLHAFAAEGLTHASIAVDADSPTGAARLYRALGFEPVQRSITWQIEID